MTPRNNQRSVFSGLAIARLGSSPPPMRNITTARCLMSHIRRTAQAESSRKPRFRERERERKGGKEAGIEGGRLLSETEWGRKEIIQRVMQIYN